MRVLRTVLLATAAACVAHAAAAQDFKTPAAALGYTPLNPANNLSDVANAATSATNLGLGTGSAVAHGSLALGGATIGSNALAVTGTSTLGATTLTSGSLIVTAGQIIISSGVGSLQFRNGSTLVTSPATNYLQFGSTDAAAPGNYTLGFQNVVGGTTDISGGNEILNLSRGTGAGLGGNLTINCAPHSTTGSTQNALAACLTINGDTKLVSLSGGLSVTGTINGGGSIVAGSGNNLQWNSRASVASPADGIIELTNNAGTSFTRLQLGGTTSSFPALKVNGAALNFRLADDSADAAITAKSTATSSASFDTGFVYIQPTTGNTVVIAVTTSREIIDPAGTLAALTVDFPPSPANGQLVAISFTQIITALTLATTDGSTIGGTAITTQAANGTLLYVYRTANTTWYPTK